MIKIEKNNRLRTINKDKKSIYFFSGPMLFDRRDQCASFEPLFIYFGPGPPPAGQPELTGLVVGSPNSYKNMVQNNP